MSLLAVRTRFYQAKILEVFETTSDWIDMTLPRKSDPVIAIDLRPGGVLRVGDAASFRELIEKHAPALLPDFDKTREIAKARGAVAWVAETPDQFLFGVYGDTANPEGLNPFAPVAEA